MNNTSNNSPVAVVDIDGVVYNFVESLAIVAPELTGRPAHHFPPATHWNFFSEQWGMTLDEFKDLVDVATANHGLFAEGPHYAGSLEGWARLRELGVFIHVATHLGNEQARCARLIWLAAHGLVFDAVTFTADKAVAAAPYVGQGRRVFAIEDNVDNYEALLAVGADAYLMSQEYNAEALQVRRVSSLADFAEVIAASLISAN